MGRRFCPWSRGAAGHFSGISPARAGVGPKSRFAWRCFALKPLIIAFLALLFLPLGLGVPSTGAQTIAERMKPKTTSGKPEKMFVEADELVYNKEKDTVAAVGNARVYYQGRVLEADRVTYDRKTGRVFAEGHGKLTERDGTIVHADRFDLTEDFRDGFIESLRTDTPDKTHFSAPRLERVDEDTTVFERGTYTACEVCKNDPSKPPLWQVRAKRIIHKNEEQMVYYEDAFLEFLGIPLAYFPFFSAPDPSVKRKSGLLSPDFIYKSQLGYGTGIPIFWALAPNYDLTFTPTYYTQQGFFAEVEWRHRFENGQYYIRATGINQQNPGAFPAAPFGAGDRTFRGSLESKGQIFITDKWKFGWEFTALTDKWYLYNYSVPNNTLSSNYFSEVTSTLYLTGQGDRGYFDLRGYYFQGLSSHDFQPQQPIVYPVWDYNKTVDIDPAKSAGIGGQLELDFNFTHLSASAASFQSVGPRTLDNAYGLYDVCANYTPNSSCLLRGIGGDYTRVTFDPSWKRKFIDPIGAVWTPFAFAHVNGSWVDLNTSRTYTFASTSGVSTYSNASQAAFNNGETNNFYGNAMPGAGVEYRYPFLSKTSIASTVFEPIGQIIVRPNQQLGTTSMINMDAQSLVFDDSTLFEWNKYSGYDRFETGTRANYGAQISSTFSNGAFAKAVFGQSYQVAGVNSYATPDAANVGLSSGLDTRRSDYVGAFSFIPNSMLSFTAKGRFDVDTFEPRRIDLAANANFGALSGSIQYANYSAQPLIGYDVRREGLGLTSKYKVTDNYFLQGNVVFDMSRHLYPQSLIGTTTSTVFFPATYGIGGGYEDECTTFSLNYTSTYQDNGSGTLVRNQTFLLSLQLRTLGGAKISQSTSSTAALDGVYRQ